MSNEPAAAVRVTEDQLDFGLGDQLLYQDQPLTGIVYELYPDGSLKEERSYEDGMPKGLCREWYDNGQLSREWIAQHGFAPDETTEWHRNGQMKSVMRRELGIDVAYSEWDASGQLVIERRLQEDSPTYAVLEKLRERYRRPGPQRHP
ncbi:hypothetical protein RDV84_04180 [Lysobacter yananisis]|uniref:Toxin-antitoxin system YwqK family antitoxin n=1 Tax=Lysobacter yananisis TaxID=1003114 RepID=A0ABY9PAF8_9GAMM|nr:hypothetical protein [Lysobacter yananisis]WMT04057.1 hypothetical protein RDV84_04180 [Lysobacter yananisis]